MSDHSITNLLGNTLTFGQTVTHYDGWQGTIWKIDEKRGLVYVDPHNPEEVPSYQRWLLNPIAAERHGRPDFIKARDHGLGMGNFIEACVEGAA